MHNIAIIRQSVSMALDNIKGNKMRSFLTMLGIVIGVASVIGLITIVESATSSVMTQFEGLGAGTLTVSATGTALKSGLTDADLDLLRETPGVDMVSPSASLTTSAIYQNEIYKHVSVEGRDTAYFIHSTNKLSSGRLFTEAEQDGNTLVAIANAQFVEKVLRGNNELGTKFILNGYTYTLIGIKEKDSSLSGGYVDNSNSDGSLIIPYRNVLQMSGQLNVTGVEVYGKAGVDLNRVEKNIRATLNGIYNDAENAYSVFNMTSLTDMMGSIKSMMQGMLGGIASISLLVGGIGIMNMMLVSVSERTKEIGLRKALGAEPSRIQMQFLIESITLSLFGGAIGIALGLLIAFIGAKVMKTPFSISYSAIVLGAGFSAAVGIIFGWMPARRASRLNPIDALRSE